MAKSTYVVRSHVGNFFEQCFGLLIYPSILRCIQFFGTATFYLAIFTAHCATEEGFFLEKWKEMGKQDWVSLSRLNNTTRDSILFYKKQTFTQKPQTVAFEIQCFYTLFFFLRSPETHFSYDYFTRANSILLKTEIFTSSRCDSRQSLPWFFCSHFTMIFILLDIHWFGGQNVDQQRLGLSILVPACSMYCGKASLFLRICIPRYLYQKPKWKSGCAQLKETS